MKLGDLAGNCHRHGCYGGNWACYESCTLTLPITAAGLILVGMALGGAIGGAIGLLGNEG